MLNWNLAVILHSISLCTKNVLYTFPMAVVIRPGFAVAHGEKQLFRSSDPAVFTQLLQSVHLGAKQGVCLCLSVLKIRNGVLLPSL